MLRDVTRALFQRPVTERYPFERNGTPGSLRGKLHWTPEGCTGCNLCVKDCPANALRLITIDKANKRFVMEYHLDRCIYCGQCIQSCRFNCFELAHDDWELAAADRTPYTVYYGDPTDVENVMAGQTAADVSPAVESA